MAVVPPAEAAAAAGVGRLTSLPWSSPSHAFDRPYVVRVPEVRQAVRVVLIDPDDRLLLLWHSRAQDQDHWAPPGGGVEPGESLLEAAARELYEEVGFTGVALQRPVWVWQHRFSYFGRSTLQHETIFACRLPRAQHPRGQSGNLAADGISAARWWTLPALASCADEIWPFDLANHARELLGEDLDPAQPRALASR